VPGVSKPEVYVNVPLRDLTMLVSMGRAIEPFVNNIGKEMLARMKKLVDNAWLSYDKANGAR
jgi:hypothetical protein